MTLASGASLPQLRYLDLSGNGLKDELMDIIPQLTILEEIHLEGNDFSVIPDLTKAFYLHTYTMTLNYSANVSLLLPEPRTALTGGLYTAFYSTYGTQNVMSLKGKFSQTTIDMLMELTKFNEDAFLVPLKSDPSLTIYLNPTARFECGCSIAWLVRDNPSLLAQVKNGRCADLRPFESIPIEEVACCSTKSLNRRIDLLEEENDQLKATLRHFQSGSHVDV